MEIIALAIEKNIRGNTINLSKLMNKVSIKRIARIYSGKKMPKAAPKNALNNINRNIFDGIVITLNMIE